MCGVCECIDDIDLYVWFMYVWWCIVSDDISLYVWCVCMTHVCMVYVWCMDGVSLYVWLCDQVYGRHRNQGVRGVCVKCMDDISL